MMMKLTNPEWYFTYLFMVVRGIFFSSAKGEFFVTNTFFSSAKGEFFSIYIHSFSSVKGEFSFGLLFVYLLRTTGELHKGVVIIPNGERSLPGVTKIPTV